MEEATSLRGQKTLSFDTSWTERGTKRTATIVYDRSNGSITLIIDSAAQTLSSELCFNQFTESFLEVVEPDKRRVVIDIVAPHGGKVRAFDLFVGAKFDILGRPCTLMRCSRRTGEWNELIAAQLIHIRESIAKKLQKFEDVPSDLMVRSSSSSLDSRGMMRGREWSPLSALPSSFSHRNGILPSSPRKATLGLANLRLLLLHAWQLNNRLRAYNSSFASLFDKDFASLLKGASTTDLNDNEIVFPVVDFQDEISSSD